MHTSSLATFLARKGQIVSVSWARPMKTPVRFAGLKVTKSVVTQARAGVTYDNMADVIAKRESGELPAENAGLPWGRWARIAGVDMFPHVIAHTPKGHTTEKHYLRFAKLNGAPCKVTFAINGKEVSASEARSVTLASEWNESQGDVFNVTADSITDIH